MQFVNTRDMQALYSALHTSYFIKPSQKTRLLERDAAAMCERKEPAWVQVLAVIYSANYFYLPYLQHRTKTVFFF